MAYNSTIITKKKRCVNCGNIDYWFSKKMCKQCDTVHSTQKRMEQFDQKSRKKQQKIRDSRKKRVKVKKLHKKREIV